MATRDCTIFKLQLVQGEGVTETRLDSAIRSDIILTIMEPQYKTIKNQILDESLTHTQPGKELFTLYNLRL